MQSKLALHANEYITIKKNFQLNSENKVTAREKSILYGYIFLIIVIMKIRENKIL